MQIKTTVGYLLTPFRMTTIKIKKKKAKQKIASIDEDVEKWKTLWVMDLKSSGLGSSPWWCLCWAVPAILLHMNPWSRRRIRWWAVFSVLTIVEPTAPVDVWCLMVRFTFSGARLTPQSWGSSALFQVRGLQRPPGGWKVSERVGSRDRSLVTSARATQHLSKDFFFFFNPWKILLKNSLPVKSWAGWVKKSMIPVTVFVKGENSSCENKWCSRYSGPPWSCPPFHGLLFSYLLVSAESQRNSILEIHTGLHQDEQIRHSATGKRRAQVYCLLTRVSESWISFSESLI